MCCLKPTECHIHLDGQQYLSYCWLFSGLRAERSGREKWSGTVRERYENGNGYDISFPDRCFPTSPVTAFCSRVSRPTARKTVPVPLPVPLSAHPFPIPFPTLTLFLPSHFPLSVHSFTISFSIVESAFFPSHIPLEHDLSQSPPINIRTNCCVDM